MPPPPPFCQILAGTTEPALIDGNAAESRLNFPQAICQPDADTLLIADRSNGHVRRFDLRTGRLDVFVGRALSGAGDGDATLDGLGSSRSVYSNQNSALETEALL